MQLYLIFIDVLVKYNFINYFVTKIIIFFVNVYNILVKYFNTKYKMYILFHLKKNSENIQYKVELNLLLLFKSNYY